MSTTAPRYASSIGPARIGDGPILTPITLALSHGVINTESGYTTNRFHTVVYHDGGQDPVALATAYASEHYAAEATWEPVRR